MMKRFLTRRALSLLTALALVVSLFSTLIPVASADTILLGTPTGYTKASDVVYDTSGQYLKNWGARNETCVFLTSYAQSYYTGNYTYSALSSKSGSSNPSGYTSSELYTALHSMLAAKQTSTTSYDGTRAMYRYTDCVNGNYSYISSFYSGIQLNGEWDSGKTWNREHTWPNSKISGSGENDIMMLRPTSVSENSSRGNKAYGETNNSSFYNPNSEAGSSGIDLRGDCARIVLYVYVRWSENANYMWGAEGVIESLDVLLSWMEADPVDTWEMGRNDAVQSITGARNCFVDYPELAFLLFGQSVPAGYISPSGGSSSSYTVTAVSNNPDYGTVSVNGYTITAAPKTGYYAAGYTVTAGTASVSQNGNTFLVTPSSDCTVQINFAAKQAVTLTYLANGSLYGTLSGYAGDPVTLPAAASAVDGWTAIGWSTSEITDTTTRPGYYELGGSFTPTADTTLFAVYSKSEGGGADSWTLLTDASALQPGMKVVMACNTKGKTAGNISGSYMSPVDSDFSSGYETITGLGADSVQLTVGGSSGAWTFANGDGKLLGATEVKKVAWGSGTTTWTVSISGGAATIQSTNENFGRFLYNSSSPRFTTYTSGTSSSMLLPQLYYYSSGSTTTYSTNPSGQTHTHSLTYTEALAPTCTEAGHSAYYYCDGCGKYFSDAAGENEITLDSTVLPALGHAWSEPAYVWSSDNSSVTATAVCANDGTHVLTETVQTSYTVITPATETEAGLGVYTAEFTDEHFTTQTKEVEIPATNLDSRLNLAANLRADEEIVLAFSCSAMFANRYESFYVALTVTDSQGGRTTVLFGDGQENELVLETNAFGMQRWFLYYYGIAAKQMGDRYAVQVHAFDAEGTEFFSPVLEGSVRDFLMGHLMNASNSGNFRRLAADMLDYGAEAQKFFHYDEEDLVNAPEDADEQAALEAFRTPDAPATTNTITQEGSSSYRFTFSLDLENKVVLFVQSTADPSSTGLQIVVKKAGTGEEVARLDAVQNPNLPNKFYANFDKVSASDMRTLYKFVMVDAEGNEISKTLSWSVDAYLAQLRTENNETLIPIVSAILVYGDSAGRYLGDPQGSFAD